MLIQRFARASAVIHYLEQTFPQNDIGIVYLYCNYNDQIQTVVNLVGSLIRKLLRSFTSLPQDLKTLYDIHISERTRPSLSDYLTIVKHMVGSFSRVGSRAF